MKRFTPPLALPNPPLKWKIILGTVIAIMPFGLVFIVAYEVWCRSKFRRDRLAAAALSKEERRCDICGRMYGQNCLTKPHQDAVSARTGGR